MCGVFGIWGHPDAARLSYLGLHALQHRGQESAGIVSTDGRQLFIHKDMGLVPDVFPQRALESLPGHGAIGHVRYSTARASHIRNAQPFAVDYSGGSIAVGHNGTLTNARDLREHHGPMLLLGWAAFLGLAHLVVVSLIRPDLAGLLRRLIHK